QEPVATKVRHTARVRYRAVWNVRRYRNAPRRAPPRGRNPRVPERKWPRLPCRTAVCREYSWDSRSTGVAEIFCRGIVSDIGSRKRIRTASSCMTCLVLMRRGAFSMSRNRNDAARHIASIALTAALGLAACAEAPVEWTDPSANPETPVDQSGPGTA